MTVVDFRLCEYFFLPVNPACTTTTSTTIIIPTTTTTTTASPTTPTTTTSTTIPSPDSVCTSGFVGHDQLNGTYIYVGVTNGKPHYQKDGLYDIYWTGTYWTIDHVVSSSENVANPALVLMWTISPIDNTIIVVEGNCTTTTTTTTSIPVTTTTTTTQIVSACAVLFVTSNGDIYGFEPSTGACTFLVATGRSAVDIASTDTKLWTSPGGYTINEFDITLTPFTCVFNRTITVDSVVGAGLTVKSADDVTETYELVGGGSPNYITKYTLTPLGATDSLLFEMGADRKVTGDIIYNANTDLYLISNFDINTYASYITQFDNTGTKIFEILIVPINAFGLYVYNGDNYMVTSSHDIYFITPADIILVGVVSMVPSINGASQNVACIINKVL